MLKEFFEVMKNSLVKAEGKAGRVLDYEWEGKVEVLGNIGMFYG